jgi:hypothetical protein
VNPFFELIFDFLCFYRADSGIICFYRRYIVHNVNLEKILHVTTPNEPGILGRVLSTLANAGIDLKGLHAYSDTDKGIFILLTSDNKKAEKAMKTLGYQVRSEEVVTVLIHDRVGAGAEIGALLGNAVIDVDYCLSTSPGLGKVLFVIKTTNNKIALETLS